MCDLTDYNKCPQCGGFLMHAVDFEVCKQCGWKKEVVYIPEHLASAEPGTTLESSKSGCLYTKLETDEWLCLNTGTALSHLELYAEEGSSLS